MIRISCTRATILWLHPWSAGNAPIRRLLVTQLLGFVQARLDFLLRWFIARAFLSCPLFVQRFFTLRHAAFGVLLTAVQISLSARFQAQHFFLSFQNFLFF